MTTDLPTPVKSCCAPSRDGDGAAVAAVTTARCDGAHPALADRVAIPGGVALVGTVREGIPNDGEGPLRRQRVRDFLIGATTVTNRDFAAFVDATGFQTEAERIGWSFVFHSDVGPTATPATPIPGLEWWRAVDGAHWRTPNGPGSSIGPSKGDHPVVQVSWNDAQAYAAWVGGRLPSEAEWEHAARGGLGDVPFPWGDDEPDDTANFPCNIWQGSFPTSNTGADGHVATAPARSFGANGYGLFNTVGNVWEWTHDAFRIRSLKKGIKTRLSGMQGYRLSKGGSFLCHRSYCYRYRIAARSGTSPDSATPHQGFRVAWTS